MGEFTTCIPEHDRHVTEDAFATLFLRALLVTADQSVYRPGIAGQTITLGPSTPHHCHSPFTIKPVPPRPSGDASEKRKGGGGIWKGWLCHWLVICLRPRGGRAFNFGGRKVDTALWLDPPPKKAQFAGPPKILLRLTPGSLEVTQNSAKNENGIFGISTSRGYRKNIICHVFEGKKWTIFDAQKIFGAFGARVHND